MAIAGLAFAPSECVFAQQYLAQTRTARLSTRRLQFAITSMSQTHSRSTQAGEIEALRGRRGVMGWERLTERLFKAIPWCWEDKSVFPLEGREYHVPRSRYLLPEEQEVGGLRVMFVDGDSCRVNGRFDARYQVYCDPQAAEGAGREVLFVKFEMHGYPDMPDQPVEQITALERLFASLLFEWRPASTLLRPAPAPASLPTLR
eukprot:CAMPEP_0196737040 /NCGR_PEP_ID=MMETSP1091-20130531/14894_1 /TAXON_ID=302021 /ORGANISM="Rhodomonas sp., Strain CCMP768" /LENGTH=202 /DNA_ID=CAMNT_0042080839 /DNA_START=73 /DNA_END=681 /DNA_ORIENTATION=+